MKRLFPILLVLAACGETPSRVLLEAPEPPTRARVSVSTVEVMEVSLPAYAEASEIAVQGADGTLSELGNTIWADDPARRLTNLLVRQLAQGTRAQVSAEPWPLADFPEARIVVRVDDLTVLQTPAIQLTGQYAIRYEDRDRKGRISLFDITVPISSTDVADIAAGYTAAWSTLSADIAGDL